MLNDQSITHLDFATHGGDIGRPRASHGRNASVPMASTLMGKTGRNIMNDAFPPIQKQ